MEQQTTNFEPRLSIELVPKSCWYSNLRNILYKKDWDKLRQQTYRKADFRCEICGEQSQKWPVECHEIWHYDDKRLIQTLEGVVALCHFCHQVKHIGLSIVRGYYGASRNHLAKVNLWSKEQAQKYISEQFELWRHRSKYQWKLDLSILKAYGLKNPMNKGGQKC